MTPLETRLGHVSDATSYCQLCKPQSVLFFFFSLNLRELLVTAVSPVRMVWLVQR